MNKKILIVVNLVGFLTFLWDDIELLQKKYEIIVAGNGKKINGTDAPEVEILKKKNIKFYQVDFNSKKTISINNLKSYIQLKRIIKKNNFLLIHCHTPISGVITRLASIKARKKGTKVIYTTHGFAFTDNSSKKTWLLYYPIEKICSLFCDAIITINNEEYKNASKMYCKRVYLIHGVGLDINKFKNVKVEKNEYRNKIGISKDTYMILSVGELTPRKNHQIIIKAIGRIPDKNKITYVICGTEVVSSKIKDNLKELAHMNNVNLILLGHRTDIYKIYKCADLAVLPSVREGLGMAGLESIASGLPIVASDVQGIREYVIDGKNGFLSSPYDIDKFKENIIKVMNMSINDIREMTAISAEIVKRFSKEVSCEEMKKIYNELL